MADTGLPGLVAIKNSSADPGMQSAAPQLWIINVATSRTLYKALPSTHHLVDFCWHSVAMVSRVQLV